jgi:hypothetical protein
MIDDDDDIDTADEVEWEGDDDGLFDDVCDCPACRRDSLEDDDEEDW